MTELQIKKLVAVLLAAFPAAKASEETAGAYVRMLGDLDYAASCAAVEKLIATSKWLPTVAEIRESTLALYVGETRAGGEAWGEALKAIGRYGYTRQPGKDFEFADPVTADCVKAMSWRELCSSENATADRARFIELYDRLAVSSRRAQLSEGLPAIRRFRELRAAENRELAAASPIGNLVSLVLAKSGGS